LFSPPHLPRDLAGEELVLPIFVAFRRAVGGAGALLSRKAGDRGLLAGGTTLFFGDHPPG